MKEFNKYKNDTWQLEQFVQIPQIIILRKVWWFDASKKFDFDLLEKDLNKLIHSWNKQNRVFITKSNYIYDYQRKNVTNSYVTCEFYLFVFGSKFKEQVQNAAPFRKEIDELMDKLDEYEIKEQ